MFILKRCQNLKTLGVLIFASVLGAQSAHAGYFELSLNGSYYKYNNGQTRNEQNTTTVQRVGAGLGYNFFGNASIEFKYTNSKNIDRYTQDSISENAIYRIRRTTKFDNYGANLRLDLAPKRSPFIPYISGGLGYMIRNSDTQGTSEDRSLLNGQTSLQFVNEAEVRSLSADGGLGFKIYMVDAIALELSFNVFASDLDQREIFLSYSASGGLRLVF